MNGRYASRLLGTALLCVGWAAAGTTPALAEQDKAEITVLYDVLGKPRRWRRSGASPPSSNTTWCAKISALLPVSNRMRLSPLSSNPGPCHSSCRPARTGSRSRREEASSNRASPTRKRAVGRSDYASQPAFRQEPLDRGGVPDLSLSGSGRRIKRPGTRASADRRALGRW
jgi:hypothetical protein